MIGSDVVILLNEQGRYYRVMAKTMMIILYLFMCLMISWPAMVCN